VKSQRNNWIFQIFTKKYIKDIILYYKSDMSYQISVEGLKIVQWNSKKMTVSNDGLNILYHVRAVNESKSKVCKKKNPGVWGVTYYFVEYLHNDKFIERPNSSLQTVDCLFSTKIKH